MAIYQETRIIKSGVEVITPERAQALLEKAQKRADNGYDEDNRPLRKSVIRTYADDMKNGLWRQTHQGIALTIDGYLIDGQHRLSAIVLSNVSLEIFVAYYPVGTTPRHLPVDLQIRRTASDILRG